MLVEEKEITEIQEKQKPSWTQHISARLLVMILIGLVWFLNYIKKSGQSITDYAPQMIIGGVILYAMTQKKADVETIITGQEAIKLADGLMEEKVKRNEFPHGTEYECGPYCGLQRYDGKPSYYVVSVEVYKPYSQIIYGGCSVNYKRPGNPLFHKTDSALRGDETVPKILLTGWLKTQKEKHPWMFGKG